MKREEMPSCFSFHSFGESRHLPKESEDDALLAKELNSLSMHERERLYEEVHGVNEILEETPEFIADRIRALKAELARYPVSKRRSFDRACFLKPSLEMDKKLYLLFLRAERFDEIAAARKLCLHFDHKLALFGEAKLPKTITLDDLDEDDMAVFQSGSYIILPTKDRSGRGVGLINVPAMKYRHWKNQVRYTWYNVFNVLLADEDVQRRGSVDVMYFVDMKGIPDHLIKYVRDSHHVLSAMPCRPCGFHICYNNDLIRPFLAFLHMVTSKERKLRERMHFGSPLEVQYALCTFGINMKDAGFSTDSFSQDYINKFLEERRRIEAHAKEEQDRAEASTGVILHPGPIDVLCGRGRPYQDFPGNIRVGKLVDEHVPLYLETQERLAKTMIAIGIVQKVQREGGRFLTRRSDGWELAQNKVARAKISQALRVRALKKLRGECLEPEPLPEDDPDSSGPDATLSQRSKRQRFSNEEEDDSLDDDSTLLPIDEIVVSFHESSRNSPR